MCAGLLNALDPQGKLRKYWVRDDPSSGANWSQGLNLQKLPNAQALDKNCTSAKYLKVSDGPTNGRSFLETFTDLRSKNAATAED